MAPARPAGRYTNMSSSTRDVADVGVRYVAIYRLWDHCLLASYAHEQSSASIERYRATVAKVVDAAAKREQPRLTVTDREEGTIHYETDKNTMYVLGCATDYPQRTAFKAIREIRERFESAFEDALHVAVESGLEKQCRPMLSAVCSQYADAQTVDRTLRTLKEVSEVRGIMGEAITSVLATHENIEILEDKAEMLHQTSHVFQRQVCVCRVLLRPSAVSTRRASPGCSAERPHPPRPRPLHSYRRGRCKSTRERSIGRSSCCAACCSVACCRSPRRRRSSSSTGARSAHG